MGREGGSAPHLPDANIVVARPRFPSRRPVERRQPLDMICRGVRAWTAVLVVALWSGLLVTVPAPQAQAAPSVTAFVDISPDNEGPIVGQPADGIVACPDPCASGRTGGRVNGIAAVPGDAGTYFAASEVGGLFKSTDGGGSWYHLDGHVPNLTWDIAVAPGGQTVYATSFYDGRSVPLTGLQMSTNGGSTWTRPALPTPSGCATARAAQPSGFYIALRPGTSEVFAGTNCGLARSTDAGDHWTRFDPTPGDGVANSVWDVVALPGGRTYACGDDGLLSSTDGEPANWRSLGKPNPFPGGYCSLAVSPDEPTVVFVVFGNPYFADIAIAYSAEFFEGRIDESVTPPTVSWTQFPYPDDDPTTSQIDKKVRVPFVATNDRSQGFDLWMGDGSLWRVPCLSGQTPRCTTNQTQWSGSFSDHLGGVQAAHGDSGDLEFDPTVSVDACPTLYSSDGGMYRNALTSDPGCHDPDFRGANVGLHAFLLRGMTGVRRAGESAEDIYMATQDNGIYYTGSAGGSPTWTHGVGGDVFDVVADTTEVVTTAFGLHAGDPGFTNMMAKTPDTATDDPFPQQPLWDSEAIAYAGPGRYMMTIYSSFVFGGSTIPIGVRETSNIDTNPLGSPLGTWPANADPPCDIKVGIGPSGPQPYVQAGNCWWGTRNIPFGASASSVNQLWTYQAGTWTQISPPPITPGAAVAAGAGFSIIAVDPSNPQRLYASVLGDGPPRMMRSNDGGTNWAFDEDLTELMNGDGTFTPYIGNPGDGIRVMPQPAMVAFDPEDEDIIVAGGRQSGVFISSDGGESWALLTDPFTPETSGVPHLPQPLFAHFDHDKPGVVRVYLGTGRGIWRVDLANADLSVTKAGAPDPVVAGTDLTYMIQVTNAGPDMAQNATMKDALPAGTTFQSFTAPAGWSCDTPPAGASGAVEVVCTNPSMAPGTATFWLVVRVKPSAPDGSSVQNAPRVVSAAVDPDPSHNTVTETTAVIARTDLRVTKTDSSDPAYAGESLTYTIAVANDGPSDATGVNVTDTLPADVAYASSSGSCVESPTDTLTCAIGALAAGAQASFTVTADIPSGLVYANGGPKTITNSASVSGAQTDPDPSDNTEGEDTLVKAKADVAIVSFAAVAPPPEVVIGQPVALTLRKVITNHGPSSPVDVSVSRTATAPAGSSVSPAASSETAVGVAKDELRTVDETFTITCGLPGAQTFSFANAIGPADPDDIDPDLSNNTASTTVTVECVVPVAINIQPGDFPNAMNLNGGATVAVLTTKAGEYGLPLAFNATKINPLSVLFGPPSLVFSEAGGATEFHLTGHIEDSRELDEKTRDRDKDMVLHFRVAASGLTTTSTQACVKGTFTAAGGATYKFFGCDSVKVSP